MDEDNAVTALAALAQNTRLAVFRRLVQAGSEGIAAGQIAVELGIPNATLSFHLKELSRAGLATSRQEARFIYYAANYAAMNELLAFLTENCCGAPASAAAPCCSPAAPTPSTRSRKKP